MDIVQNVRENEARASLLRPDEVDHANVAEQEAPDGDLQSGTDAAEWELANRTGSDVIYQRD